MMTLFGEFWIDAIWQKIMAHKNCLHLVFSVQSLGQLASIDFHAVGFFLTCPKVGLAFYCDCAERLHESLAPLKIVRYFYLSILSTNSFKFTDLARVQ